MGGLKMNSVRENELNLIAEMEKWKASSKRWEKQALLSNAEIKRLETRMVDAQKEATKAWSEVERLREVCQVSE
jgi:hypothetical protein